MLKVKYLHRGLLVVILVIIVAMAVPTALAQVTWSNDAINYDKNYLGPPLYCILSKSGMPAGVYPAAYELIVTNATSRAEATDGEVDVDDLEYVMADYLVDNMPAQFPNMTVAYAAVASWEAACGWPPPAHLSVQPSYVEVAAPGDSFLVNITVTNVTNMLGFEFKLQFDTDILTVTGADEYGRDTLGNVIPSSITAARAFLYVPLTEIPPGSGNTYWTPLQNLSDGFVWAGAAFNPMQPGFTGSGTLMSINFTSIAAGNSTLHLFETEMTDSVGNMIAHRWFDGLVHVIPEFLSAIIAPLLMTATLAAVLLGKMVWSRKHKDALTAK